MLRAWKGEILDLAGQYVKGSARAKMSKEAQEKPSYLGGSIVGRHMMTALVESEKILSELSEDKPAAARQSFSIIDQAVREVIAMQDTAMQDLARGGLVGVHGLVNGTSGRLHALLLIRAAVVGGKSLVTIELIERAALYIIAQGQRYAVGTENTADIKRIPLQFKLDGNLDLGAAHGLCGIVVVLLDAMDALHEVGAAIFEDSLRQIDISVRLTVTYILELRLPSGNLRSRPDSDSDKLVQWCHGAVGLGLMLVRCAETLGGHFNPLRGADAATASSAGRFLDRSAFLVEADCAASVAKQSVQHKTDTHTWEGPGLCHGASGCAYLFLQLWNLTGHEQYLDEAHALASMLVSWPDADMYPSDSRSYSLFEGVGGALCLVADLRAAFSRKSFFPGFGLPQQLTVTP